ncbi:hypothetical protein AB1484_34110 [Parafrankia sp. FMc6]|uniref:hypothetical protein n=1 Tax=Parafrankia soli TaxID=2599596 RepID=UPI0034D4BE3E
MRPLVSGVPHAAALLGEGSEVLGFDDEISTDHDFGPRVQLFVPPGFDATPIDAALGGLPARFDGFPVVYPDSDRHGGRPHHQVEVTTAQAFFVDRVGIDPADGTSEARTGSSQPRWPAHHPAADWHHTTSTAEGIHSCG